MIKHFTLFFLLLLSALDVVSQSKKSYTASFIGRMGVDTVLVETYTMMNNHIYGKAFIRVPEDYIGEFSIHFYPNGTIREFNVSAMHPMNSSVPYEAKTGAFEYRLNMNCANGTCTYYNSDKGTPTEHIFKHAADKMDFVGGWVPLISLIEWNCMRLIKSGQQKLPLKMINHNIGVYDIGVHLASKDTAMFGGPFLEYTKINIDSAGRILNVNGTGTPWNYLVTRHDPINIDQIARRMTQTPGIGIPSPPAKIRFSIKNQSIDVSYGRPYKRGRKIFGGVVPYDSLWRTGAGAPTIVSFEKNVKIGGKSIPKGQYSIYSIPKQNEWLLIFNTDLKTWPTDPNRRKDFTQIVIATRKNDTIEQQFKIDVKETKKGGTMIFSWDDVSAYADFETE